MDSVLGDVFSERTGEWVLMVQVFFIFLPLLECRAIHRKLTDVQTVLGLFRFSPTIAGEPPPDPDAPPCSKEARKASPLCCARLASISIYSSVSFAFSDGVFERNAVLA